MGRSSRQAGKGPGAGPRDAASLMALELGIYRELGALAARRAPLPLVLRRLMDYALKASGCRAGAIYLYDKKADELTYEVVRGGPRQRAGGRGERASRERAVAWLVAGTGHAHVSRDVKKGASWKGVKAAPDRSGGMLAVPLRVGRRVTGVIEVGDRAAGRFTRADLEVLESLANHFSVMIESSALVAELDGRVRQFSVLNEVGSLLISTLDQKLVRRRALESITRLMRAEADSLILVDEEKDELYFEVVPGSGGGRAREIRFKMGEGIAGWVARHGKPLIVNDAPSDPRFSARADRMSRFRTRDMVCVPVSIKGRTIGVLQAINRVGGGGFTGDDLALFQLFAKQVAIALENARLYDEARRTLYAISEALAEAIEKKDPYTGGHTKRVLDYSLAAGRRLGMTDAELDLLKFSAVLHDIGKIGIEDGILRKAAPLDPEEAEAMKRHPMLGAEILKRVPQLRRVIPGMLHHHERVDGKGYPSGFRGAQIPLAAKIIAVADTFDAMTTTRPYRAGMRPGKAIREIRKYSGTQFDSSVVEAFTRAFEDGEFDRAPAREAGERSTL